MAIWGPLIAAGAQVAGQAISAAIANNQQRTAQSQRTGKSSLPAWDAEQTQAANIILQEVEAAQLPPSLAVARPALGAALLVNAWHESRLRPTAHNPNGEDSWGLFQLNRSGGLGAGYSGLALSDPRLNTRLLLREVWAQHVPLELAARTGTVADLTAAVTTHVERPRHVVASSIERARTTEAWWPDARSVKASAWRT